MLTHIDIFSMKNGGLRGNSLKMSGDLMGCSATSGIQGTLDPPSTVKKMVKKL